MVPQWLLIMKVRFSIGLAELSMEQIVDALTLEIDDKRLVGVYRRVDLPRDMAWHISGEEEILEQTAGRFKAVLDDYGVTDFSIWHQVNRSGQRKGEK